MRHCSECKLVTSVDGIHVNRVDQPSPNCRGLPDDSAELEEASNRLGRFIVAEFPAKDDETVLARSGKYCADLAIEILQEQKEKLDRALTLLISPDRPAEGGFYTRALKWNEERNTILRDCGRLK